jgi:hypothetical protein
MAVATREQLKQYCLRELGAPVLEINVDEDQLEDRIDDALEKFRIYHHEGTEKFYLKHQITETDKTNKYIPIPDAVYGVTRVFPTGGSGASGSSRNMFDMQYQLRLHDLYDLTSTSIIYYEMVRGHLALLDMILNGHTLYRFNRLQNRLHLDINWESDVSVGEYVLVECYRALDPATFPRVYNEPWLKHFTTALFKRQWATNLKKFQGLQLPGGVVIDGDKLYQEAVQEMKELEDDLINKSAPLEFFLG